MENTKLPKLAWQCALSKKRLVTPRRKWSENMRSQNGSKAFPMKQKEEE